VFNTKKAVFVLFYLLFLFSYKSFSQSRLIDKENKQPISEMFIYDLDDEVIAVTSKRGFFKVKEDSIKIKSVVYGDTILKNKRKIYLSPKAYVLSPAEVKARVPILIKLKNALKNTENLLPKDTMLYYDFEIYTEIPEMNWHEEARGVYRIDISKNNKVKVSICKKYCYEKDSIDDVAYKKITHLTIKKKWYYSKRYDELFDIIEKRIKENYKISSEKSIDTFKLILSNEENTSIYNFNDYLLFTYEKYKPQKTSIFLEIDDSTYYTFENNNLYVQKEYHFTKWEFYYNKKNIKQLKYFT
jgi:hypothetical protein